MSAPTIDPVRIEDLFTGSQRMPVVLCADVSHSMLGEPLDDLNAAIAEFFRVLAEGALTRATVEVAVVAFASSAEVRLQFQALKRVTATPRVEINGRLGYTTNLGLGVVTALDLLKRSKAEYKITGMDHFQPILVILSDAQASEEEFGTAAAEALRLEAERRLVVLPVAIGPRSNLDLLRSFSKCNSPMQFRQDGQADFFAWLADRLKELSHSQPGLAVRAARPDLKGWVDFL